VRAPRTTTPITHTLRAPPHEHTTPFHAPHQLEPPNLTPPPSTLHTRTSCHAHT
jgi:hypothetical protein